MKTASFTDGAFRINGDPFFMAAADYQYYRDLEENWTDRIEKLKMMGVNTITFYIPWRHHSIFRSNQLYFDFTGETRCSRNLIGFMDACQSAGLFMIAKPGPFIHSELNVGGLPDYVSPTYNPSIETVRSYGDEPFLWPYDSTEMPAPFADDYDQMAKEWLTRTGTILQDYVYPKGHLIGIQLLDETIYCRSNNGPWAMGYEPSAMKYYHRLLEEKYPSLDRLNRIRNSRFERYSQIPPMGFSDKVEQKEDIVPFLDWGEFQWKARRDIYNRYKTYLNIDLPYITNYAPICPPIGETMPDTGEVRKLEAGETPEEYEKLYADWWYANNRIDYDREDYHYGFISWLGVTPYDPRAFFQFINTASRRRGLNMEENYGFGVHYDPRSAKPIVPFYQSLLSIAAGGTGYVAFVGVGTAHYDAEMDKISPPPYPSDAPITHTGETTAMFDSTAMLNKWLNTEAKSIITAEPVYDLAWFLIPEYSSIASWLPDESKWLLKEHQIPRNGALAGEEFCHTLHNQSYSFTSREIGAVSADEVCSFSAGAAVSAFFMPEIVQHRLVEFMQAGRKLILAGELPLYNEFMEPCTHLKQYIEQNNPINLCRLNRSDDFLNPEMSRKGLLLTGSPKLVSSNNTIKCFLFKNESEDILYFFGTGEADKTHKTLLKWEENSMELEITGKSCGAIKIGKENHQQKIESYIVKSDNEIDQIHGVYRITLAEVSYFGEGDECFILSEQPDSTEKRNRVKMNS